MRLTARERVEEWLDHRIRVGGADVLDSDLHFGIMLRVDDLREVVEENKRLESRLKDALDSAGSGA